MIRVHRSALVAIALVAIAAAGCGDGADQDAATALTPELRAATTPRANSFPSADGKSLADLVDEFGMDKHQLVPATSSYTAGRNRIAFAVADADNNLLFGETAIYVANGRLREPARGPFLAPADLLPSSGDSTAQEVSPPAIYSSSVSLPALGRATVFALTKTSSGLVGSAVAFRVRGKKSDPVVRVGRRAPIADTGDPSPADIRDACTRNPPDSMHKANFANVVGKRPIALIISTPALCESRVCGPVIDVAAKLRAKYGDRVEFIHQEVFNDNDPRRGLRKPLRQFGVVTEPWLFTIDKSGRVAARLEGAFGFNAFESAVRASL